MTTRHHTPSGGTTPYTAEIDGDTMVITYVNVFDGETTTTTRTYGKVGATWIRAGTWRRAYTQTNAGPPPSGTYTVSEWTGEEWTPRETGTYHD